MWFVFALIAIVFWSGSDLFSKMGSKPEDKYSHWKMVMAVGLVMGLHAIYMLAVGTEFAFQDMITYLPASFLYILAMVLGYAGLRYIMLSISTPICNGSGAVACILCYFFLHESLDLPQIVAILLITLAVIALAVAEKKQDDRLREISGEVVDKKYTAGFLAILFPILYCIIDALGTFADAFLLAEVIEETQANIAYEFTFLFLAICAFIYVVLIKHEKILIRNEKAKGIAACCETAGQFAYVYAIGANAIVAAPMISSYCLFSLIWARLILKEKLSGLQKILVCTALVGIVILGIYDA